MKDHRIVATLTYGKTISKRWVVSLLIVGLFLGTAIIPLAIVCAVLEGEYGVLTTLVLPVIVIPVFSCLLFVCLRERKDTKKWKKDAVSVLAQVKEIDRITNFANGIVRLKISVRFYYDGRMITQRSGEKDKRKSGLFHIHPGYDSVYRKYAGRTIPVLYSPMYDEVLLPEDRTDKEG